MRVWTTRAAITVADASENAEHAEELGNYRPWRPAKRRYPSEALIFDSETETGPAQRLRLLVWRRYSDGPDRAPGR